MGPSIRGGKLMSLVEANLVTCPGSTPPSYERRQKPGEPEVLPLALAGNWIAWSSDGMQIVAWSRSLIEVENLAHAAGEPDPIFERHPGVGRL